MTEHGADGDDRPALHERVRSADILVIVTPTRPGDRRAAWEASTPQSGPVSPLAGDANRAAP